VTALVLALLIPWVGGVLLLLADGRRRRWGWAAVAAVAGNLAALVALAVEVLPDGHETIVTGGWEGGIGIVLRADALGVTFALLSSFVVLAALVHEVLDGVRSRTFPALVVLLSTGLTGLFLTGDVFNFYVFFELAMISAYVLTAYGDDRHQLGAALIFAVVNLVGSFLFLIAVAAMYHVTGTLSMEQVAERMGEVEPNAAILIAVTFFVAFGTKLGLFPFHFWLPAVYAGTRPAVAAILSGALANIGAYGLLRFGAGLLPEELALGSTVLIVIGSASVIYGALLAVSRRDPAEMLAYSSIGQAGYVLVALGVGGPIGLAAAVLYAILNALSKALLFLSGALRGALVAGAFAVGALSLAGMPPTAGFLGKLALFRTGVDADSVALIVLLFCGGALAFVYAFQLYQHEFWRGSRVKSGTGAKEAHGAGAADGSGGAADSGGSGGAVAAPAPASPVAVRVVSIVLALLVLALGLWPEPLLSLSSDAAAVLHGGAP
jgi:multicomponent Na+:H+ antiporter subunit D